MIVKYTLNNQGVIENYITQEGINRGFTISPNAYSVQGNEPFLTNPEKYHWWRAKTIINEIVTEWEEIEWTEVTIVETKYPKGQCIVELSNSDILIFECTTPDWTKATVIAKIKEISKYTNTNIL